MIQKGKDLVDQKGKDLMIQKNADLIYLKYEDRIDHNDEELMVIRIRQTFC